MQTYTTTQARQNIYSLVADTELNGEPIQITGKNNDAVLISKSDWDAIQETLYLVAVPGMADSITDGMNTPLDECSDSLFDEED